MKRRKFLQTGGTALSVPAFLNGLSLSAIAQPFLLPNKVETNRRLVLIQLNGGNDGLNTLIPLDQYVRLKEARSNIIIPQNKILPLTDRLGLHPSMDGVKELFDEGRMGIVQSVGYAEQNRSHFRSMDIWETGSPSDRYWDSGWLGRYLENRHPGYPSGYPNSENPDPFAISMGYSVSKTCQGSAANISISLNNPFSLKQYPEIAGDQTDGSRYGEELDFLRSTLSQTNAFGKRISKAADSGRNQVDYPSSKLAKQLKNVALLMSGGLKTKIFIVSLGGFDTHADQAESGDPTSGRHASLLTTVSEAVTAFTEDLKKSNLDEEVLAMTFSEFGRQIRSNGSLGTDHGAAAPLFLFGACVNGKILGSNPEIGKDLEAQAAVPLQFDFRDIYGSVLMDWFGATANEVKNLMYDDFTYVPILKDCREDDLTTSSRDEKIQQFEIENYPNPFQGGTNISFMIQQSEKVRLAIFNALGQEVRTIFNRVLNAGKHQYYIDGQGLPAGNYYYRLVIGNSPVTGSMIKVR